MSYIVYRIYPASWVRKQKIFVRPACVGAAMRHTYWDSFRKWFLEQSAHPIVVEGGAKNFTARHCCCKLWWHISDVHLERKAPTGDGRWKYKTFLLVCSTLLYIAISNRDTRWKFVPYMFRVLKNFIWICGFDVIS